MDDNGRFGFDPEDLDRVMRDVSEGVRDAFERISRFVTVPGERAGWSALFEDLARRRRTEPETAGEAGDGDLRLPSRVRRRRLRDRGEVLRHVH